MRHLFSIVLALSMGSVCLAQQPNIILINLDDADQTTLAPEEIRSRFPFMSILALRGINFNNMHVTTPLCTPSRASLFRGQYAHNTQIRGNDGRKVTYNGFLGGHRIYSELGHDQNDLSTWMQDRGYRTMMVGKYLNGDVIAKVPPGWDDFYSSWGNKYYGPKRFTNRFDHNGKVENLDNRVNRTVVEMNDALRLIDEQQTFRSNQPFFLYIAPLNTHQPGRGTLMYEERYETWWPSLRVPRLESFSEIDMSDKRGNMRLLREFSFSEEAEIDIHYRERFLSMKTWDNQFGRLMAKLNEHGLNDNTYVILTSDNGWVNGEHRLVGKANPYELTHRVPCYVIGPGIVAETSNDLLAHIDIGPTILDLAGGSPPAFVDGVSFRQQIENQSTPPPERDPVLIENWRSIFANGVGSIDLLYTSLRFKDRSYIEWHNGEKEYYDLNIDPLQLRNSYDQLSTTEQHSLGNRIREIKTPMIPDASFRVPFEDNEFIGRNTALEGFAEDDFGFYGVKIAIRDETTFQYWNGSSWQANYHQLDARLSNPDGQITSWRLPLHFPEDQVTDSPIKVFVWAVDPHGNYNTSPPTKSFRIDHTGPEITLTSPEQNETVQNPAQLIGAIQDESNIREIRIVVYEIPSKRYWNGASLQATRITNDAILESDGAWSFSASLPAGRYYVSARGFDEFGNYSREIAKRVFRVE